MNRELFDQTAISTPFAITGSRNRKAELERMLTQRNLMAGNPDDRSITLLLCFFRDIAGWQLGQRYHVLREKAGRISQCQGKMPARSIIATGE
jgi:hypothetical protein